MSRPQSVTPPHNVGSTSQSPSTSSHSRKRKRGEKARTSSRDIHSEGTKHERSRSPSVVYRGLEDEYEDRPWEDDAFDPKRSGGLDLTRGSSSLGGQKGWTYHLEIIQQPQRARACGFGNKDRRPLSPPPIIRLWIRTASGTLVDPNTVDTRFLILLVDLWSADRQQERNVVMHPVSAGVSRMESPPLGQADLQPVAGPSSRPSTGNSRPMSGSSAGISSWSSGSWRQPTFHSPAPPPHVSSRTPELPQRPLTSDPPSRSSPLPRSPQSGWTSSRPPLPPSFHRTQSFGNRQLEHEPDPPRPKTAPSPQYPLQPAQSPSTSSPRGSGILKPPYSLPPLASIAEERPGSSSGLTLPALQAQREQMYRPSSSGSSLWGRPRTGQSMTDVSTVPTDYTLGTRPESSSSSNWSIPTEYGTKERPSSSAWPEMRPWSSGIIHSRPTSSAGLHMGGMGNAPPSPHSSQFAYNPKLPEQLWPPTPGSVTFAQQEMYPPNAWEMEKARYASALPAAQYSRVLVGKVTAVCHKLQDENDRPGLYFFAADLGIRTEGTFTLRMTMTDIASMMAPEVLLGSKTPILAEAFSKPFTVYSAKRFPGVIPTTNLTKVFAAQGVKLSVRETKKGAAGGGDDGDDDDDD
ncbi:uncharacterized protein IL334_002527 [Kwoniella shivajii]|uniref:Velvet domain-containing protein n=1 Tax=Kwoniella shivajii TaxID=564305 RepID=A0ABZ1CW61_9TREE|nr:hypothetical protein IL334_002527 [Kwoniella shivajii]